MGSTAPGVRGAHPHFKNYHREDVQWLRLRIGGIAVYRIALRATCWRKTHAIVEDFKLVGSLFRVRIRIPPCNCRSFADVLELGSLVPAPRSQWKE